MGFLSTLGPDLSGGLASGQVKASTCEAARLVDAKSGDLVVDTRPGDLVEDAKPGDLVEDAKPGDSVEDAKPGDLVEGPMAVDKAAAGALHCLSRAGAAHQGHSASSGQN